jgi:peptidyl-prolyl cis-trans isomerase SurA
MEERPAAGKMKVEQILIAYDKSGGAVAKTNALKFADSLYNAAVKGASFEKLAANYSYDNMTRGAGGLMPLVGVGGYEKPFEDAVFALKKNGEIAKPFETSNGFHIVKRLEHIPVEKNFDEASASIQLAVKQDKRSGQAKNSFEKKVKAQTGIKKTGFAFSELWRYTDSSLKKKPLPSSSINEGTVLLEFPKAKITTAGWIRYASISPAQASADKYLQVWNEFETAKAIEYYRNHLDEFSPEFNQQLKEFMEGNLLFEIMERKVWTVSASDTAGLRKYYNLHKSTYVWNKSADAIMVNAADSMTAVKIRKQLALKPASWKKLAAASDGNIIADSGRVEWSQIPAKEAAIKAGMVTPVVMNEDRTSSFTYVIKTYPQPTPRAFNDARGLVMNDYQQEIENKWIGELKKKYPVNVNEAVLESIIKN